jgi:hypothetical protein
VRGLFLSLRVGVRVVYDWIVVHETTHLDFLEIQRNVGGDTEKSAVFSSAILFAEEAASAEELALTSAPVAEESTEAAGGSEELTLTSAPVEEVSMEAAALAAMLFVRGKRRKGGRRMKR